MIIETDFHAEAVPYIESCLLMGKGIAKYVLEKFKTTSVKKIFSFLPPDLSYNKRMNFSEGGISTSAEVKSSATKYISAFLKKSRDHIVVFEHPYALAGDEFLKNTEQYFFVFRSEIYPYLKSSNNDYASIERLLSWTGGYPLIGILTSVAGNDIKNRSEVDNSVVEKLVENFSVVICGVYDNETLLFWKKNTN
jgi:hypothetical protein